MWRVSSRSGVATLRTAIHLLLTPSSRMRIVLLDITGGVRNVSESAGEMTRARAKLDLAACRVNTCTVRDYWQSARRNWRRFWQRRTHYDGSIRHDRPPGEDMIVTLPPCMQSHTTAANNCLAPVCRRFRVTQPLSSLRSYTAV